MAGTLRITQENWSHFQKSEDPLTKEKYRIGDVVTKCDHCKSIFHHEYLEDANCPCCLKPFVAAPIELGVIHLGTGGASRPKPRVTVVRTGGAASQTGAAARTGRSTVSPRAIDAAVRDLRRRELANFTRRAASILLNLSVAGFALGVSALVYAGLTIDGGWKELLWDVRYYLLLRGLNFPIRRLLAALAGAFVPIATALSPQALEGTLGALTEAARRLVTETLPNWIAGFI